VQPLKSDHSPVFPSVTPFQPTPGDPWSGYYDHREWGIADLYVTDAVLQVLYVSPNAFLRAGGYEEAQLSAALDLLRSVLWRKYRADDPPGHLVLCRGSELPDVEERLQRPNWDRTTPVSLEQLMLESVSLSFDQKVGETLVNVRNEWRQGRKPLQLPHSYHTGVTPGAEGIYMELAGGSIPSARGMAYGCNLEEEFFAFKSLLERGWLSFPPNSNNAVLSAKGYGEIVRIEHGKQAGARDAFLVRRWDPSMDGFFNEVSKDVLRAIGVKLEPVWAVEHNERIDERIFASLNSAAVVVVDIDKAKFNVGLEAGYALALRKPIVAIRQKPGKNEDSALPFDIVTLNCYDYTIDSVGRAALTEKLCARITFGLARASLK